MMPTTRTTIADLKQGQQDETCTKVEMKTKLLADGIMIVLTRPERRFPRIQTFLRLRLGKTATMRQALRALTASRQKIAAAHRTAVIEVHTRTRVFPGTSLLGTGQEIHMRTILLHADLTAVEATTVSQSRHGVTNLVTLMTNHHDGANHLEMLLLTTISSRVDAASQ